MFTVKLLLGIWAIINSVWLGYKVAIDADKLDIISCQLWFLISLATFYFY